MLKPWKICGDPETMRIRGNTEIEFRFLSEQGDKERRIFPEQWHFFQTVWEDGYVISYCGREGEYIDMVPILENLYMNADNFLDQISEVRIQDV